MNDAFSSYHPLVNFFYFSCVIVFAMVFMHPLCLGIALLCSFIYSISLKGRRASKFNFLVLLPMLLFAALLNPAFNHEGVTILTYLPSGNPLTLESIVYGLAAATMLVTVICWFSCYNVVMTTDKFVYLFGRVIPALSLILSMILRFVPRFKAHLREVADAQKCLGRDVGSGSLLARARQGMTILSIMVTWALENAIETADSMRCRGYGLPGRSAFALYKMEKRDKKALLAMAALALYVLIGGFSGALHWHYFPSMAGAELGPYSISVFVSYFALCISPLIIDREEARQWNISQARI